MVQWKHKVFSPEDKESILKLRQQVFSEPQYDGKRWDWQYKQNPMGESFIDLAVDHENSSVLAGHYAVISYSLQWAGKEIKATQSLDTFTNSDYRKQGIFTGLAEKTYSAAKDSGVDVVFGFPNHQSYPGFVKKLNFIDPFGFGIFKKALSTKYYTKKISGLSWLPGLKLSKGKVSSQYRWQEKEQFCEEIQPLLDSFNNQKLFMVKRTLPYLDWRYQKCPDRKYRIFYYYKDKELIGSVVASEEQGKSFVHLVDIITLPGSYSSLLDAAIGHFSKEGYQCMTCYTNKNHPLSSCFIDKGFQFTDKSEGLRFILRSLNQFSLEGEVLKSENWFLVGGDTDFY